MINYVQKPVKVFGSTPGEVYSGRMKQVTCPIATVEFTPGTCWKPGQQLSFTVEDPEQPMKVDAVVLANDATGTSLWVTFNTILNDTPQIVLDPGPVYITIACDGTEHRALARQVAEEFLRVETNVRLPVGTWVEATVHIGMVPILVHAQITCAFQPVGSARVLSCLRIDPTLGHPCTRWKQYIDTLRQGRAA